MLPKKKGRIWNPPLQILFLSVGVGALDNPYKNIIAFCADDRWSPVFKDRRGRRSLQVLTVFLKLMPVGQDIILPSKAPIQMRKAIPFARDSLILQGDQVSSFFSADLQWQFMAQPAQLHPHELLPFFLSLTIVKIARATIAPRTMQTNMVGRY